MATGFVVVLVVPVVVGHNDAVVVVIVDAVHIVAIFLLSSTLLS